MSKFICLKTIVLDIWRKQTAMIQGLDTTEKAPSHFLWIDWFPSSLAKGCKCCLASQFDSTFKLAVNQLKKVSSLDNEEQWYKTNDV